MLTSARTVRSGLLTWAVCSVLFAGTVLLFSRAAGYDFSNYDDPSYVTNNPHVQAGLTWQSVVWAFTAPADYWHPLTWLSHMLDWQLYGPAVYGHHLSSLLWHATNAVIVFLLFRRLTGAYWTSAFSAALFAWHPLRVESVVWITERKDVMSGFFFLVTIWAYASYASRRETHQRAWHYYALTLVVFIAGLMSKPMLVTVPAVLLVLDFWPLQRVSAVTWSLKRASILLLEKAPFFVLSAVASVVTVLMQQHKEAFVLHLSLTARVANAVVSLVRYLGKFVWPFDLTVCYPHPGHWPLWVVSGSTLLLLAITAAAWSRRRTHPWQLAGWLGFGVMLLPAIGIIQVGFQAMADRYTYLSILFLQFALLWTLRTAIPRTTPRWVVPAFATAVLAGLAVRTWDQQATWRDPVTMFQHAIAVTGPNEFAHAFLSYTFFSEGRLGEAEQEARQALEINPRNATALLSLANTLEAQNRGADAIAAYRTVLAVDPAHPQSAYQLGGLLLQQGQTDEALTWLVRALQRNPEYRAPTLGTAMVELHGGRPANALFYYRVVLAARSDDVDARFGEGLALNALGQSAEAKKRFEAVVAAEPKHAGAHTELGLLLLGENDPTSASVHFRAALEAEPNLAVAHVGLGRAAEKLGQPEQAAASFAQAMKIAPKDPLPPRAWAETLARRQHFAEAAPYYRRAIELDPNDATTRAGLGFVLVLSGDREGGIAAWKEALRLNPQFPGLRERLQRLESASGR